jgi:hypothetical protein
MLLFPASLHGLPRCFSAFCFGHILRPGLAAFFAEPRKVLA